MTLVDDYLALWGQYSEQYGINTALFYQVGSFHECYSVINDEENIGNCHVIGDLCRLVCTKKNKKIKEISRKNPTMLGFPSAIVDKFVDILVKQEWTVIVYNQHMVENTIPQQFERKLDRIYSPGTLAISNQPDNLWACSLTVEYMRGKKIINIASIDITTGENDLYFYADTDEDKELAVDCTRKLLASIQPKEIVVNNTTTLSDEEISLSLELAPYVVHYDNDIDSNFSKPSYQNEFLKKLFDQEEMFSMDPIEYLGLNFYSDLVTCYIILLDFIYKHENDVIKKIRKPTIHSNNEDKLQLLGDTLQQLNLLPERDCSSSLLQILDKTSTAMGKRLLKNRLTNPITSAKELTNRYNNIDAMVAVGYDQYDVYLKGMSDIERLHRKMTLNTLHPAELSSLDVTYQRIKKLLKNLKSNKTLKPIKKLFKKACWEQFKCFMTEYNKVIDVDEASKYSLSGISGNFFHRGVDTYLDVIQDDITKHKTFMTDSQKQLSDMVDTKKECVKLVENDVEGHYLTTTIARSKVIKSKDDSFPHQIEYRTLRSVVKLNFPGFKLASDKLRMLTEDLKVKVTDAYLKRLAEWSKNYSKTLSWVVEIISEVDLIASCAKTSVLNGYHRPELVDEENVLDFREIRHPIIEKVRTEVKFVDNDVLLDNDNIGMLIFGLNSSGKSTLLKSVALNVIMAQTGMFIPCILRFKPLTKIICKLSNRDNILKGKSTFILDVEHIQNIVNRSDKNTLVLSDELTSGTDRDSAVGLITGIVHYLRKKNVFFLFSSHYHDLVKTVKNVRFVHFKVKIENNIMIFDRKIAEGSGNDSYGIEVAKSLGVNTDIIRDAMSVRRKLTKTSDKLLSTKTSRYNSKVYVDECSVCGKSGEEERLHTHHLLEQEHADDNNMIGDIPKNVKHNLVVLCEQCHHDVHNGKINIYGYQDTSNGVTLKYTHIEFE